MRARAALVALALAAPLAACGGTDGPSVTVGLITKQEVNPYWVTMRETAQDVADDNDVTLLTATGSSDTDVASQEAAIEDMLDEGVDGILIAPADSTALLPAIERARAAGVLVVALDTPVEPTDAVDAYLATDNLEAGRLVGEYAAAKVQELGLDPQVVTLAVGPGVASSELRDEGFFAGFGIAATDSAVVAAENVEGDQDLARAAMEDVLASNPEVNVVYAVNEPAALGALDALDAAGADLDQVVVVSVDGGCEAVKGPLRSGRIDATAMQFPQNMAREGVLAVVDAVREQDPPSGYIDTATQLVSGDPAPGVDSRNVAYGVRTCWGG